MKTYQPPSFDPHQFVYRANGSIEDAIAIKLHPALSHLEHQESFVRKPFIDYSSAFNTIIPDILVSKLSDLGFPPHTPAPGLLISPQISDSQTRTPPLLHSCLGVPDTGSPEGCVLSQLLDSLYTSDWTPAHSSNTICTFAEDTTVVELITRRDKSAYRDEVLKLSV